MPSLESLIRDYGYWAILIGTFLEGETILVLGGIAAQQELLNLYIVMLFAFCGSFAGDQLAFSIGRHYGAKILERRPKWKEKADYLFSKSARFLDLWMVIFRFFYGLRNPTPWVLGAGNVSYKRFLLLNFIGAALWAVLVSYGGYAFGLLIESFVGRMRVFSKILIFIIIVVVLVGCIWYILRKRKQNKSNIEDVADSPKIEENIIEKNII
ncbi:MAG: DedA family protein [Leptospirales bacterium]|nr:DedA family protein [Leptospirales bacterium]